MAAASFQPNLPFSVDLSENNAFLLVYSAVSQRRSTFWKLFKNIKFPSVGTQQGRIQGFKEHKRIAGVMIWGLLGLVSPSHPRIRQWVLLTLRHASHQSFCFSHVS